MKIQILLFCAFLSLCISCGKESANIKRTEEKVLIVSDDLSLAKALVKITGNYSAEATSELEQLNEEYLKNYSALVLLQVDINNLNPRHKSSIQRYLQAGGGIITFNNSTPLPYSWHWYDKMIAFHKAQDSIDKHFHQFDYDGGRIAMGIDTLNIHDIHNEFSALIQSIIESNTANYDIVTTPLAPYFHHFRKKILDDEINEPMELAILPDNRVLFIERRGKMKIYEPKSGKTRLVSDFNVCVAGNYEDGLLGLELDPDFNQNNFLYLYYSPPCEEPNQYLSRFVFKDDSLHLASEIVMLKVLVQRETCCHSGGSVQFGPDGLLYLSTGDNTSSKESDGYTPIDERPGRAPFDAQKSSGNTHDLRGKILRIKPEADGTYSIPDGNLFPKDGSKGRPEIFVMGARNPFRISIDKNNYVYWGDVGPDSGVDGIYGTQSYDEWNQARTPGNYGWPFFQGDNKAFPDRNFTTGEVGELQVAEKPINTSPNNTGSEILPPARPAMIWYPYGKSEEFPLLGTGSRSAMAGPFYYPKSGFKNDVKFPEYYTNKMFIYEWARSWVMVLTFDDDMNMVQMEPFMPNGNWSKPIDMEIGPDGAMYTLEYGQSYFMDNPDASLARIEYSEQNQAPIANLTTNVLNGKAPLHVQFSAQNSYDFDKTDTLTYQWFFTDESTVQATTDTASFVFDKNGIYHVLLKITDSQGATTTTSTTINVGNAAPNIDIALKGNQTFYFKNQKNIEYAVNVTDEEDENINLEEVAFNVSFISDQAYLNALMLGNTPMPKANVRNIEGKKLIDESDCRTCHNEVEKSIGPSYVEIAKKYESTYDAMDYLTQKVIKGGSGNWGESLMAAHPQHSKEEVNEMIKYIMSLSDGEILPLNGRFDFTSHQGKSSQAGYLFMAAYEDKGANEMPSIQQSLTKILRYPRIEAEYFDDKDNAGMYRFGEGLDQTMVSSAGGYIVFKDIDLNGIKHITFRGEPYGGGKIVVRIDDPKKGTIIGRVNVPKSSGKKDDYRNFKTSISPKQSQHDIYIIFDSQGKKSGVLNLDWLEFSN